MPSIIQDKFGKQLKRALLFITVCSTSIGHGQQQNKGNEDEEVVKCETSRQFYST